MVLASDLSFQLGDTGVVLNDDSTSLPFADIYDVKGLDSAPFRITQRDHEGGEGGYMDAEFEKGRDIVLSGTVIGDASTFETYLDDLKGNWAPSRDLVPLYFRAPGVSERLLFVKPLGVRYSWDGNRRNGTIEVQFGAYAEDPRIYTNSLITTSVNLGATVFTGFNFSFDFNFDFGGISSTTDQLVLDIEGNRPTPPVFIIHGPVTDPRILNDTYSKEMVFSPIVLSSTDTLVVDVKNRTVKLNGVTNRRNTLQAPTWFDLAPGQNTLRFRAGSSDPAAFLEVQYRPAWR